MVAELALSSLRSGLACSVSPREPTPQSPQTTFTLFEIWGKLCPDFTLFLNIKKLCPDFSIFGISQQLCPKLTLFEGCCWLCVSFVVDVCEVLYV